MAWHLAWPVTGRGVGASEDKLWVLPHGPPQIKAGPLSADQGQDLCFCLLDIFRKVYLGPGQAAHGFITHHRLL